MNEIDPYKHIRALAESISHIDKQIGSGRSIAELPIADEPQSRKAGTEIGALADALRAARVQNGLTQRDLGRRAGVPQSHISKIESGAVDLRLSSIIAIARVLGLTLRLEARDEATPGHRSADPAAGHRAPALADFPDGDLREPRAPRLGAVAQ